MDDFEYYSLTDENIMVNTMIIFKRALDLIEPNKRPFHNFNENPDLYYIHSFIMDKWKIENQVSILKVLQKNCDNTYNKPISSRFQLIRLDCCVLKNIIGWSK